MIRRLLLYLSTKPALGRHLERAAFTKRVVRRFVAGETVGEALAVIGELERHGLLTAVTYLGENVTTPKEAQAATETYLYLLDEIHRRGLACVPSVKLTHLGLDLETGLCVENLERLLDLARAHGNRVWVDMEDSAYTDRTLALYRDLRGRYDNVACVIQAYLYRSAADLEDLIGRAATVRLCKGAYREPPRLAFPGKAQVDASYERLMTRLLSREVIAAGVYPALATHDERLIERGIARAREQGIPAERFEFQMLYGIRPDLHRSLPGRGVRLRVLVSFGEDWYRFFVRRLAERPANLLFFLRHLVR